MEKTDIEDIINEAEEEIRAFERCSKVVTLKLIDALKQIKNHSDLSNVRVSSLDESLTF